MSLFNPRSYTTELSPKSIRQVQEVADTTKEEVQFIQSEPFAGNKPGLVPESDEDTQAKFLRGDGKWANPPGGGGGTSNYEDLANKPAIDGNTLDKNTTAEDLGLAKTEDIPDVSDFITKDDLPGDFDGENPGLVPAPEEGDTGKYLKSDGTWGTPEGGGSGDAELESDVTSNLAVGAIASGTTLAEGTTFTEFVQKLLITEVAPTINFSISKSGNVAYGGSYTETLTVTCSAMGSAKKIKKIEWYQNNTLLRTDTIDSATTGSWTYTMDSATTDTTTFKAVVTYVKSNDAETSVTKTAGINFYYNKFYGAVSDVNPSEATVEALTSALATAKGGTYSFTVTAGRICYAYPKSLGALTSIKDGNGFSLFDSFTRTEQTYTQNGTSVTYYRYVLTDPTTVSGYSVIFA